MIDSVGQELADEGACADAPGLRGLLQRMERWKDARDVLADGLDTGLPRQDEWPELPALHGFTLLWTRLHADARLRSALAPAPALADAGPLNSSALVHRMLRLMQAQSPGYLQYFTAYVDMLASLQALQATAAPAATEAPAKARRRRKAPSRA